MAKWKHLQQGLDKALHHFSGTLSAQISRELNERCSQPGAEYAERCAAEECSCQEKSLIKDRCAMDLRASALISVPSILFSASSVMTKLLANQREPPAVATAPHTIPIDSGPSLNVVNGSSADPARMSAWGGERTLIRTRTGVAGPDERLAFHVRGTRCRCARLRLSDRRSSRAHAVRHGSDGRGCALRSA